MNRNLASALTIGATAAAAVAVAALGPAKAYADDITIDTTPFVSSKSRAEVQAELMRQPDGRLGWAARRYGWASAEALVA